MKQGLPQVDEHTVVVLSITYNQSRYIEDTLNGFAMQQTEYPFLCCVFDDASTDGEQYVLKSWIENHCNADEVEIFDHSVTTILMAPDKDNNNCVYVFHLLKVNSYGKPAKAELLNYWRQHGKYVAFCEGDDYWTDPLKLQKQVDFLESHPDFSLCSHRVYVYRQNVQRMEEDNNRQYSEDFVYDLDHFVAREGWITQTLSLLYRRSALDLTEYYKYKKSKDVTLIYTLLKSGKGIMLNELMGVYRIHDGGVWQGADKSIQIKSDLDVMLAIYERNRNRQSAVLLRRSLYLFGFLGWPFFRKYFKTYIKTIWIIFSELGIIVTLKAIVRSLKFF